MQPITRFTTSGNVHIAYQVIGDGPLDLVYVPGWVSHAKLAWEEPPLASFLNRLASFPVSSSSINAAPGFPIELPTTSCRRSRSGWMTCAR